jgi:hypothetical protein
MVGKQGGQTPGEFVVGNGQASLPTMELIEGGQLAAEEFIDVLRSVSSNAVMRLRATAAGGPRSQE